MYMYECGTKNVLPNYMYVLVVFMPILGMYCTCYNTPRDIASSLFPSSPPLPCVVFIHAWVFIVKRKPLPQESSSKCDTEDEIQRYSMYAYNVCVSVSV